MSIGISLYPLHAQKSERLLNQADQALYAAKARGKNGYVLYSDQDMIGNDASSRA